MNVVNRPIQAEDKTQWLALWKGYNDFYGSSLADEITEHTWQRILSPESPIFGRVAGWMDAWRHSRSVFCTKDLGKFTHLLSGRLVR